MLNEVELQMSGTSLFYSPMMLIVTTTIIIIIIIMIIIIIIIIIIITALFLTPTPMPFMCLCHDDLHCNNALRWNLKDFVRLKT